MLYTDRTGKAYFRGKPVGATDDTPDHAICWECAGLGVILSSSTECLDCLSTGLTVIPETELRHPSNVIPNLKRRH